ncbi:MAG: RagB/SusD family nutrient uptake outer membrane protein [Bacteroidales bacterium]|jgi:hypothetical protein|nr:RagB/SusD family nutrient uptake outer membrane protein [Bacteroidales bacterium]
MNKIKLFLISCIALVSFSCNDLDVPPLNIVGTDDLLSTEQGVGIYMANIYGALPMWNLGGIDNVFGYRNSDAYTGYQTGKGTMAIEKDMNGLWKYNDKSNLFEPYDKIRDINVFIEQFPAYSASFAPEKAAAYTGEAYFLRAFYYFNLVKRYGGVPLVDRTLNYPAQTMEELTLSRSKEVEIYDFILEDLDKAIRLLPDKSDGSVLAAGRANRYIAYGMKARVALYAGSIAKYGTEDHEGGLLGIPSSLANGYFQTAYAAADTTKHGGYALYNADADKAENFANIFGGGADGVTLPVESMFARSFVQTHNNSYAGNNEPYQMASSYASDSQPYLEMIEFFEDVDGNKFNIDPLIGTPDNPVYYDSPLEAFANLEPRAKGSVILPMSVYCGEEIEVRKGILPAGKTPANVNDGSLLVSAAEPTTQTAKYNDMYIQGKSGIGYSRGTSTGFLVRKWLCPTKKSTDWNTTGCLTPYIEMRYAEMLLTKAEAAVELGQHLDEAVSCMNQIRERAGSNKRFTTASLTIEAVRNERRLEFYDEDKTYWDFRRWRIAAREQTGGRRHVLWPVYVWDQGKYYLYKTEDERANYAAFDPLWYYNPIPTEAIDRNKLLKPNPNN